VILNHVLSKVTRFPSSAGPQEKHNPVAWGEDHMEILTVQEVAALLKMSKRQVYTVCETRTREGSMKNSRITCAEDQRQPEL
jgi:hypothetical protein